MNRIYWKLRNCTWKRRDNSLLRPARPGSTPGKYLHPQRMMRSSQITRCQIWMVLNFSNTFASIMAVSRSSSSPEEGGRKLLSRHLTTGPISTCRKGEIQKPSSQTHTQDQGSSPEKTNRAGTPGKRGEISSGILDQPYRNGYL